MKRVVIVCNAPHGLKEGLERHRGMFLDKADHLTTIAASDTHSIATKINLAYIANAEVTKDYEAFALVLVVNASDDQVDQLRLRMPGPLFMPIAFAVDRPHNKDFLDLARQLRIEVFRAGKLARALKKEFQERDSRTPLLLPVRNFKSKDLERLLLEVQRLTTDGDYDAPLKKLLASGNIQASRESHKKTFFENGNAIRFYGPSKAGARHGGPSGKPPHDERCLVNGYFRLGARYDTTFHYDCQYETGHIKGEFPNCHDGDQSFQARTHINIAPSDALR
ncbi:hypothetical protein ACE10X_27235 [Bradyrhizobium sp. Pha-3]|uniref:hypothetical protein n=1 Tax=Bradyrhizobium sp. Pha-3 TaxID=208375 RepID=UPI0035D417D6